MNTTVVDKKLLLILRKQTYAGFSDCQKALEATNNNLDEAVIWLRKNGIAKASSKYGDKSANEGKVVSVRSETSAAIIELNSETDFTANSEPFVKLSKEIAQTALTSKSNNLEQLKAQTLSSGQSLSDSILSLSAITGEKIDLRRVETLEAADTSSIAVYNHHDGKLSSMINLDKAVDPEMIKNLAIHLAANNPKFITSDETDEQWLANEKSVAEELLKKDPKAKKMFETILENKLKKIVSENTFLSQAFLFDGKKKIQDVLDDLGAKVVKAICFAVGK